MREAYLEFKSWARNTVQMIKTLIITAMKKGKSKSGLIATLHMRIRKGKTTQRKVWQSTLKIYPLLTLSINSTNLISLFLNNQTMIPIFKARESNLDCQIKIRFIKSMSSIIILLTIKIQKFTVGTRNFRTQTLYIIRKNESRKFKEEVVLLTKKIE